jgi:hypothetical protein
MIGVVQCSQILCDYFGATGCGRIYMSLPDFADSELGKTAHPCSATGLRRHFHIRSVK